MVIVFGYNSHTHMYNWQIKCLFFVNIACMQFRKINHNKSFPSPIILGKSYSEHNCYKWHEYPFCDLSDFTKQRWKLISFQEVIPHREGKDLDLDHWATGNCWSNYQLFIYINKWIGNTNEYGEMFNKLGHAIITLLYLYSFINVLFGYINLVWTCN